MGGKDPLEGAPGGGVWGGIAKRSAWGKGGGGAEGLRSADVTTMACGGTGTRGDAGL